MRRTSALAFRASCSSFARCARSCAVTESSACFAAVELLPFAGHLDLQVADARSLSARMEAT